MRTLVSAASRGRGTLIFEDSRELALIGAAGIDNGVAILRYRIQR